MQIHAQWRLCACELTREVHCVFFLTVLPLHASLKFDLHAAHTVCVWGATATRWTQWHDSSRSNGGGAAFLSTVSVCYTSSSSVHRSILSPHTRTSWHVHKAETGSWVLSHTDNCVVNVLNKGLLKGLFGPGLPAGTQRLWKEKRGFDKLDPRLPVQTFLKTKRWPLWGGGFLFV